MPCAANLPLILGYGNPLRADDGFGWYAAQKLTGLAADVRALHQLTPELAEPISRADQVIFIDASREGEPGVLREEPIRPAASSAFTHHVTPATLLALARELYGRAPEATLFTAAGESFAFQMALSPSMEVALSHLCRRLLSWNHMLNPYAAQLGDRNPVDVIADTPRQLQSLIDRMGPAKAGQSPAPGKWSPREVLCHLADAEIAFAFRLRQTLAEDHHVIQPFDQDKWSPAYSNAYDAASALAVFSSVRNWNVALIRAAGPAALAKKVMHPERGEMTFETIVQTMAGHDLNHLRQLA